MPVVMVLAMKLRAGLDLKGFATIAILIGQY